jgi:stage II sporulation protein M
MSDQHPPDDWLPDTPVDPASPVIRDSGIGEDQASQLLPDSGIGESQAEQAPPDSREGTGAINQPRPGEDTGEQQPADLREISRAPVHRVDGEGNPEGVRVSRSLRATFRQMGPWLLAVALLFILTLVAGVIIAIRDPSIGTTLMDIFRETILAGIDESNPYALTLGIFLNNLQACILLFLGGASFGILTVFILGSNGLVIGAVIELVRQEKGALFVIAAILPHGIFEIPAFLISSALGLMLARSLWREWHGLEDAAAAATRSAILFITIVVPVVVLAAFIEAFITPHIIDLVI